MSRSTRCALLSAILFTFSVVAQNTQSPERDIEQKAERTAPPSKESSSKPAAAAREMVKASDVMGVNLKNRTDETVGEVEDCLIDLHGQRVAFLIVGAGGFLGIGEHHAIMPFRAVSFRKDARSGSLVATIDTTKERLKKAPAFDKKGWQRQVADADWRAGLEGHYGVSRGGSPSSIRGMASFVMASELLDADIENAAGEEIAELEDLVIELDEGYVAYARLDLGGFLGIAEKSHPVPLSQISRVDGKDPRFVTSLSKAQLEKAPTLARGGRDAKGSGDPESPEFVRSVHEFYQSVPPWAARSDIDTASLSPEPLEIPIRISEREPHRFLVRVDTFRSVSGQREQSVERDQRQSRDSRDDRGAADGRDEPERAETDEEPGRSSGRPDAGDDSSPSRRSTVLGAAAARAVETFGVELVQKGESPEGKKKIEVCLVPADSLEKGSLEKGSRSRAGQASTSPGAAKVAFTASVDEAGRVSDVEVQREQEQDEPGESSRPLRGTMSKEMAAKLAAWLLGEGLHDRKLERGATIEAGQLSEARQPSSVQGDQPDRGSAADREPGAQDSSWAECVNDVALKFEGASSTSAVFSIVAATCRSSSIEPASGRTDRGGLSSDRPGSADVQEDRPSSRDRAQGSEDDRLSRAQPRQSTGGHVASRLGTVAYRLDDGLLDWMVVRMAASVQKPRSDSHPEVQPKDDDAGEDSRDSRTETDSRSPSTTGSDWDARYARSSVKLTIERI